jgi:hypothetical protein
MLVDSGSTHSFISEAVVSAWPEVRQCRPMQVKVADGGLLRNDLEVHNCRWSAQGAEFITTLCLFPLGCYDVILGIDWLQTTGDMNVNWGLKRLSFLHQGKSILLQGIQASSIPCQPITIGRLEALLNSDADCHMVHLSEIKDPKETVPCPAPASDLLAEFADLFTEPHGLPPRREFDHKIALILGSRPVNLRPYHYNPEQKDEIERQMAEMLCQGIIQFSTSPFSSPVLLVIKGIRPGGFALISAISMHSLSRTTTLYP